MEIGNTSSQAASSLSDPSQVVKTASREKLPSEGQKIPSAVETKELEQTDNKQGTETEVTKESLQKAVESLNSQTNNLNRNIQFSVDDVLDRTVIRVVDTDTKKVIRQIPSEEVLSIARRVDAASSAILDVVA